MACRYKGKTHKRPQNQGESINETNLGDVYEAGAPVLEAEEGAVAHDVLDPGRDELARVLSCMHHEKQ